MKRSLPAARKVRSAITRMLEGGENLIHDRPHWRPVNAHHQLPAVARTIAAFAASGEAKKRQTVVTGLLRLDAQLECLATQPRPPLLEAGHRRRPCPSPGCRAHRGSSGIDRLL